MNSAKILITTDESSRQFLKQRIEFILDLMDKEHHHCSTHAQRNAYQAVIRHELELIQDNLTYARTTPIKSDSDIPW
jgi:hypothetical protein